jgi:hypothetical protein
VAGAGAPDEPESTRPPAMRASDAERERAVATLRDGAEHGRLTFDELAQRTELAYNSTTGAELERLVADLPAPEPGTEILDAPAPAPPARNRQRWNIAIMGGCERRGRWRPAPRSIALAIMGGVGLDLRDATIDSDELVITAVAVMGGVDIVVPEGVDVQLSGFALMGGNDHHPGTTPVRAGTPTVYVRAFSLMGGVDVKVKRPKSLT